MALCRTVGFALKCMKPSLINPCPVIQSSVNLQVRHAARKGYREKKAKRQKKNLKLEEGQPKNKEFSKLRTKFIQIEKTVNLKKPEPPADDVFLQHNFNYKKYSLSQIVEFHKEYHHPTVYNNPNAPIGVKIEIDMTGKKMTQVMKSFSGVAAIPHPFTISHNREILVLCGPEDRDLALESGAAIAGGADVIKKIQEGVIQPTLFDYVISPTSFLPELTPIRSVLKDQMPRAKRGTLTNDLKSSIYRFLHGIEYSCLKYGAADNFGVIQCFIGTTDMEAEQITSNFRALVEDIETNKPPREGDFVVWTWCTSPPSNEEFSVDLSEFVKSGDADDFDDED